MAAKCKGNLANGPASEVADGGEQVNCSTVTNEVKHVSDIIGDWGWWQTNVAIFCISVAVFSSFNGMVPNFYQPKTDFICTDEKFVSKSTCTLPPSLNCLNC